MGSDNLIYKPWQLITERRVGIFMKLRNDAAVVLPVGGAGDSGFFVERGGVIQESSMESILVLVLSRTTLPGGAT